MPACDVIGVCGGREVKRMKVATVCGCLFRRHPIMMLMSWPVRAYPS